METIAFILSVKAD